MIPGGHSLTRTTASPPTTTSARHPGNPVIKKTVTWVPPRRNATRREQRRIPLFQYPRCFHAKLTRCYPQNLPVLASRINRNCRPHTSRQLLYAATARKGPLRQKEAGGRQRLMSLYTALHREIPFPSRRQKEKVEISIPSLTVPVSSHRAGEEP